LKILDSGSPPAFAGVARNDHFPLFSRVLQEPQGTLIDTPKRKEQTFRCLAR
jgi:hypothetical protein